MNTDKKERARNPILLEEQLTEKVLAAAFKVQNTLGCGFLEKVYENAMAVELRRLGILFEQQKALQVRYNGAIVGEYLADLVIDTRVIVECKAATQIDPVHEAQLINYLKATGLRVGMLLNFGRPKVQYRRLVV